MRRWVSASHRHCTNGCFGWASRSALLARPMNFPNHVSFLAHMGRSFVQNHSFFLFPCHQKYRQPFICKGVKKGIQVDMRCRIHGIFDPKQFEPLVCTFCLALTFCLSEIYFFPRLWSDCQEEDNHLQSARVLVSEKWNLILVLACRLSYLSSPSLAVVCTNGHIEKLQSSDYFAAPPLLLPRNSLHCPTLLST